MRKVQCTVVALSVGRCLDDAAAVRGSELFWVSSDLAWKAAGLGCCSVLRRKAEWCILLKLMLMWFITANLLAEEKRVCS